MFLETQLKSKNLFYRFDLDFKKYEYNLYKGFKYETVWPILLKLFDKFLEELNIYFGQ